MAARHSERVDRPVFVVGPTRSGTTVVRHALNRHPDLAILPETHLLDVWLPRFPATSSGRDVMELLDAFTAGEDFERSGLDTDDVRARVAAAPRPDGRAVLVALLCAWGDRHGASRVGEKTPAHALHVPTLFAWFPDARVVWLRRDPRDTTASQMRFTQAWAADDPVTPARHWARVERAWRRHHRDPRVCTVVYEDLVNDPDRQWGRLLDHLELPVHADVVAGPAPRPGEWHGGHDPAARLTSDRVGRWRGRLSPVEVGMVDGLTVAGRRGTSWASAARTYHGADRWAYRLGALQGWGSVLLRDAGTLARGLVSSGRP